MGETGRVESGPPVNSALADVREVPLSELAEARDPRPRQGTDRVVGHGDEAGAVAVAAFQSSI